MPSGSSRTGAWSVTEVRQGLRIETTSFVGSLALGPIQLRIQPKLRGAPLLTLLRYAYGLRHLDILPIAGAAVDRCGFEDLLLFQLAAEVTELVSRGLHRSYVSRDGWLALPQGRIDFNHAGSNRRRDAGSPAVPNATTDSRTVCRIRCCSRRCERGVRVAGDDGLRTRLQHLVRALDEAGNAGQPRPACPGTAPSANDPAHPRLRASRPTHRAARRWTRRGDRAGDVMAPARLPVRHEPIL